MDLGLIKEHGDVIGADGVHVGTVDHLQGDRIKPTRKASSDQHRHYVPAGLIAGIAGGIVRLPADADIAVMPEERS